MRRLIRHALLFVVYGAIGGAAGLLGVLVWLAVSRLPDLAPWHEVELREEFTSGDAGRVADMAAYRALEERLFTELRHEVYERIGPQERRRLNRYNAGSPSDATAYAENFNRSWELPLGDARAGVLMLHGLSDSPYSLRPFAEILHGRGCHVVGLRLPGHGTIPAALKTATWEDWAAAVRIAARDLRLKIGPDAPLYVFGYSTGAALAVEYALARLGGEDLPRVDGLVLVSPAIGVDPLAALAPWQLRLAALPGLHKLAWLDVTPEYDPYKYNSFAVNAGLQIYELTQVIDQRIGQLAGEEPLRGFPRTLVFQSVADATVSPAAVVRVFLQRLAAEGHELVAFDINRNAESEPLLRADARAPVERLLSASTSAFDVTLLTNVDPASQALVALHRPPRSSTVLRDATTLTWPAGTFALSHVALPMPPDDPIYGARAPAGRKVIWLGRPELQGENGLLAVPATVLLRLRFNPFFGYVEERTLRFMHLAAAG